jgi:hypothetical protein
MLAHERLFTFDAGQSYTALGLIHVSRRWQEAWNRYSISHSMQATNYSILRASLVPIPIRRGLERCTEHCAGHVEVSAVLPTDTQASSCALLSIRKRLETVRSTTLTESE